MVRKVVQGFEHTHCDYCGEFIHQRDPAWTDERTGMVGCCRACAVSAVKHAELIHKNRAANRFLSSVCDACTGE